MKIRPRPNRKHCAYAFVLVLLVVGVAKAQGEPEADSDTDSYAVVVDGGVDGGDSSLDPCAGVNCGDHQGTCVEGICHCSDDYTGDNCEQPPESHGEDADLEAEETQEAIDEENEASTWDKIVSKFEINGYIENETAFRLHSPHHFSKVQNLLQLEMKVHPLDWLEVYALVWAMYDATYDIYHDDYSEDVRDEYRSNFTSDDVFQQTLREVYLDVFLDFMDIRLGRQQVIWGEATGLRITDVVNPQDYREFILDDFVDSRIPLWMAKLNFYAGDWTFTALWIPFFEPNRFALAGSDWEWTFNRPQTPPGMTVVTNDPKEPEVAFKNGEIGGRVSGLLASWNVAASYLYTWDDSPSLHSNFDPQTSTLTFNPRYHRMHVTGLTFSNALGPFVPQGEISYQVGKFFPTEDSSAPDGLVEKQFLHYMVGTDYTVGNFLFNLQFIQKIIIDYEEGIFEDQVQNSLSFWIQGKLFRETLRPELLAIYVLNDGSWWIRPKVAYDLTDAVMVTAGGDILIGGSRSFLGQFDSNDRVFAEVKYSF